MASIGSREPVRRVLVAGIARSGTTWITHALRECSDVSLVHEPDNDRLHPEAAVAKADLGLYPLLRPGDPAPAYARLFRAAYGDAVPGPATGGATVVKSVHAALALDWLLTEVPVDAGLVVVGSRGRGGFTGMLLGSVASKVLHLVDVPVLLVK